MKQLVQNLRNGAMELLEVDIPRCGKGQILVRVHHSVVSPGTEGKTVKDARAGYLQKARARKEEVRRVLQSVQTNGFAKTFQMVSDKLDAPQTLGYSCSGEVISTGEGVVNFSPGDYVACAGSSAGHAEVVVVPENLCAKVQNPEKLKEAAFSTIGAIALQGVRQADLRLGESCVVIGLGIVGQITLQLLQLSGIKAFGVDVDQEMVKLASKSSSAKIFERSSPTLENQLLRETAGHGADAVIITAGTSSLDPIELAGRLCRMKGKVVVVGNVPTGFSRKTYYTKELDLRMSMSYGPGRYQTAYEEKGLDYPLAYVRWTENRNLEIFVRWLEEEKLYITPLISREFNFEEAKFAYDEILQKQKAICGIVFNYNYKTPLALKRPAHISNTLSPNKPAIGFIGAGSFAKNFLLPNLKGKVDLISVATGKPHNAKFVSEKFGFRHYSADAEEIIASPANNMVFIVTRHNSHANYVLKALRAGKNVYVEKPLCLHPDELEEIADAYKKSGKLLMIGFNRRFAPLTNRLLKEVPQKSPKLIRYRINAGVLPPTHWVNDPETGGGRILGELCHFIDFCLFLSGGTFESISARAVPSYTGDTVTVQLGFSNGSVASIDYCSNGSNKMAKEEIEVFCDGVCAKLQDFKTLEVYSNSIKKHHSRQQDKGHAKEMEMLMDCLENGGPPPVSFEDCYAVTSATFKVLESIKNRGKVLEFQEKEKLAEPVYEI